MTGVATVQAKHWHWLVQKVTRERCKSSPNVWGGGENSKRGGARKARARVTRGGWKGGMMGGAGLARESEALGGRWAIVREMVGLGGGLGPPIGKTSPTHASGAREEREGPRGGISSIGEAGLNPALCWGKPLRFPNPVHRAMGNTGVGKGGEGGTRYHSEWRRTVMGAPIAMRTVEVGGRGGY